MGDPATRRIETEWFSMEVPSWLVGGPVPFTRDDIVAVAAFQGWAGEVYVHGAINVAKDRRGPSPLRRCEEMAGLPGMWPQPATMSRIAVPGARMANRFDAIWQDPTEDPDDFPPEWQAYVVAQHRDGRLITLMLRAGIDAPDGLVEPIISSLTLPR